MHVVCTQDKWMCVCTYIWYMYMHTFVSWNKCKCLMFNLSLILNIYTFSVFLINFLVDVLNCIIDITLLFDWWSRSFAARTIHSTVCIVICASRACPFKIFSPCNNSFHRTRATSSNVYLTHVRTKENLILSSTTAAKINKKINKEEDEDKDRKKKN